MPQPSAAAKRFLVPQLGGQTLWEASTEQTEGRRVRAGLCQVLPRFSHTQQCSLELVSCFG